MESPPLSLSSRFAGGGGGDIKATMGPNREKKAEKKIKIKYKREIFPTRRQARM
jgi:hypothetical protein